MATHITTCHHRGPAALLTQTCLCSQNRPSQPPTAPWKWKHKDCILHPPCSMDSLFGQFLEDDYNQLPLFGNNSPWNVAILPYRSREPSVAAPEPTELKRPSPQDWHNIRPLFTKLYSKEDRTLKDVKSMLERDHGFVAK